jgi:DNA-directed RNA polymerase specialized sigma24 family protein
VQHAEALSSPESDWVRQRRTKEEWRPQPRVAAQRAVPRGSHPKETPVANDPCPDPELLKKLKRAMLKLPRTTRAIYLAHRLDDMSYQNIADRTGLTVRHVERHMAKAIYRLCKELDDEPRRWWERLLGL